LLNRIVTRVASRRVEHSRPQADAITADHTAKRINKELDESTKHATDRVHNALSSAQSLLGGRKLEQTNVLASTTHQFIQIIVMRDDVDPKDTSGFVRAPKGEGTQPDIEVNVHSALVFAAIADSEARESLKPILESNWYRFLIKVSMVALLSSPQDPAPTYRTEWTDGGNWLRLSWTAGAQSKDPDATVRPR
jgi:hypothetical protein